MSVHMSDQGCKRLSKVKMAGDGDLSMVLFLYVICEVRGGRERGASKGNTDPEGNPKETLLVVKQPSIKKRLQSGEWSGQMRIRSCTSQQRKQRSVGKIR